MGLPPCRCPEALMPRHLRALLLLVPFLCLARANGNVAGARHAALRRGLGMGGVDLKKASSSAAQAPDITLQSMLTGCPVCGEPEKVGVVPPELPEMSGLTASVRHPGCWYAITDSPKKPEVYVIRETGEVVQTVRLADIESKQEFGRTGLGDWEDITVGPCDPASSRAWWAPSGSSPSCVFVADIGHNCARTRACHYHRGVQSIIRFPEPISGERPVVTHRGERMWWKYPDGAGEHDAESLLATPDGELFIVTKEDQAVSTVYHLPDICPEHTITAVPVAQIQTPKGGSTRFTAADAQFSGGKLIGVTLHTLTHNFHFTIFEGEGGEISERTFMRQPCSLPAPTLAQPEAFAWDRPDGGFYLTTSEATGSDILKVSCSSPAAAPGAEAPRPGDARSAAASPAGQRALAVVALALWRAFAV